MCAFMISSCSTSPVPVNVKGEKGVFSGELKMKETMKTGANNGSLRISDSKGQPVVGADISITPWMPAMDHGVMWHPKITEKADGFYDVLILLSMGGQWELRTEITKGGQQDKLVFMVPDVQGKKGEKGKAKEQ